MTTPTSNLQLTAAAEVRAWLGRRQMSASRAARQLGWTQMYLSRRLRSEAPFDLNDLEALARLLDVPVTDLLKSPVSSGTTTELSRVRHLNRVATCTFVPLSPPEPLPIASRAA